MAEREPAIYQSNSVRFGSKSPILSVINQSLVDWVNPTPSKQYQSNLAANGTLDGTPTMAEGGGLWLYSLMQKRET